MRRVVLAPSPATQVITPEKGGAALFLDTAGNLSVKASDGSSQTITELTDGNAAAGLTYSTLAAGFETWTALASFVGMKAGNTTQVRVADTDEHTDPISGLEVENAGSYRYSASPPGWERIGDSESQTATKEAAAALEAATNAAADVAAAVAVDANRAETAATSVTDKSVRFDAIVPPIGAQRVVAGTLGDIVAGFVDKPASGLPNFLAGLTTQGAWAAKIIQALGQVVAPSVSTTSIAIQTGGSITDSSGLSLSYPEMNYQIAFADAAGNVVFGVMDGALIGVASDGGGTVPAVDLDQQDAADKAHSLAVYQRRVTTVQKPTADFNVLLGYGQSLMTGNETWPALSRTNRFNNLQLGGHPLPSSAGATYNQFTPTGLQPLVAFTTNFATEIGPSGEPSLAAGDQATGEPPNIGWANGCKALLNDYLLTADAPRKIVTANAARAGRTIGELSKTHTEGSIEYYGRVTDARSQIVTAVGSASCVETGVAYLQGEYDYYAADTPASSSRTYTLYKAKFAAMAADLQADAVTAFASKGQIKPPAFLSYQTGGSFTRDADVNGAPGLHVGMAQLDYCMSSDTAWMVTPSYPFTDKGGHLDSNGSRWMGHYFAKVWNRVVLEGRNWEPLRPIRIWQDGPTTIYVAYHVPVAPLVFDEPQTSAGGEFNALNRGFRLTDKNGGASVISAQIVRDTIVKLNTSREIDAATGFVWYASQAQGGNGMVRDSDPALAVDNYVYEPERGMYASANLSQFVNKPYPLWNWGVAFYLPVGYQE